jgi:hypothetical protein
MDRSHGFFAQRQKPRRNLPAARHFDIHVRGVRDRNAGRLRGAEEDLVMRKIGLLAAVVSAGVVAVVACGGSSDNPPEPPFNDGGADTSVADTGKDTNVADSNVADTNTADTAVCTPDADTSFIPDAALGDSGASVGSCIGCAHTSCSAESAACAADCDCTQQIDCIFEKCSATLSQGVQKLFQCALGSGCVASPAALAPALTTLGTCILQTCPTECGVPPTPDAGPDSSSDAESDAPADAPSEGG